MEIWEDLNELLQIIDKYGRGAFNEPHSHGGHCTSYYCYLDSYRQNFYKQYRNSYGSGKLPARHFDFEDMTWQPPTIH